MSGINVIVQVAPAPGVTDTVTYEVPQALGDLFATLTEAKAQRESAEAIEREAKAKILSSLPALSLGKKVIVQVGGLPVGRLSLRTRRNVSLSEVVEHLPNAEELGLIHETQFPVINKA